MTPEQRRRRIVLGGTALLVLLVGVVAVASVTGGSDDAAGPQRVVRAPRTERTQPRTSTATTRAPARPAEPALDAEQLAGSLVMLRFIGPTAPEYVLRRLAGGTVAGVVLFEDNVVSPEQLAELTATLQEAGDGRVLVATDQEGGAIRQLPFAEPVVSAGATSDVEAARAAGLASAEDLAEVGVNLNLAPVADVATGPVLAGRAYPGEPEAVAALARAFVEGTREGGVLPAAKHFPGLGAATTNTDDGPATIDEPIDDELVPFRAAIAGGTDLVMVGHALYPAVDPDAIASQSPVVLGELLREELGFRGAVVTDSLEAEAVLARSEVDEAAVASVRAGVDLLLTTGQGSYIQVLRRLTAEIERDPAMRARAEEALGRVRALQERLRQDG